MTYAAAPDDVAIADASHAPIGVVNVHAEQQRQNRSDRHASAQSGQLTQKSRQRRNQENHGRVREWSRTREVCRHEVLTGRIIPRGIARMRSWLCLAQCRV